MANNELENQEVPAVIEEALVAGMAKFNITYNGENGDLADPVSYDSTDADLKQIATETVRNGDIPGIEADPDADFNDFVIDRYPAKDGLPNRLLLRPKTPFGG